MTKKSLIGFLTFCEERRSVYQVWHRIGLGSSIHCQGLSYAEYRMWAVRIMGGRDAYAAHECGHAVQHAKGYEWLKMRSILVPMVGVTSNLGTYLLLGGILLMQSSPCLLYTSDAADE